jgi:hypothetical protein
VDRRRRHAGAVGRLSERGVIGAITDAAGPDTMTYEQLVRAVRGALGRRAPILHAAPAALAALARVLGVFVRDVVLTDDEIRGLTARLLVSDQPELGRVSFLEWLQENASTLGRAYERVRPSLPRARMIL